MGSHLDPVTIDGWQRQLRTWVLRAGVSRVMDWVGASRPSVYSWIHPRNPVLPKAETCRRLDDLMATWRRS